MVGENVSYGGRYGDEDDLVEAEDRYRDLDLPNFPVASDVSCGNDVLLEAYEMGVDPGDDGEEIRNGALLRHLNGGKRGAVAGGEWMAVVVGEEWEVQEDNLRALRFAADVAGPYDVSIGGLRRSVIDSSEAGIRARAEYEGEVERGVEEYMSGFGGDPVHEPLERVRGLLEALGLDQEAVSERLQNLIEDDARSLLDQVQYAVGSGEPPEAGLAMVDLFRERYPGDWESPAGAMVEVVGDVWDAGVFAVAEGLHTGDEGEVLMGRQALQGASAAAGGSDGLDGAYLHVAELRAEAVGTEDLGARASLYTEALQATVDASGLEQVDGAVRFFSGRLLSREGDLDDSQWREAVDALSRRDVAGLGYALQRPEPEPASA